MRRDKETGWANGQTAGISDGIDCETLALMRRFITPVLETAESWDEIADRLAEKGYGIAFREGHLVILGSSGDVLCTGRSLGMPLRQISERIGRPSIRADRSGHAGELH